jgi:hypothetical protein
MPSAPTLRLEPRPSRLQRGLAALLVAGAVLALLLAPWPLPVRAAAVLVLLAIAAATSRRTGVAVRALEWRGDGSWWQLAGGDADAVAPAARPLRLRSARVIGPLLALRFIADDQPLSVDLWPDSADADVLRRLRIRLQRLQAGADGTGP